MMRPRKLILENIGPFVGRTEIDFEELGDIFLITGKTGSGKTTVFDSLCYALYGILPGGRRNQTRRLRSDFVGDEANCSVSLEFELGDRVFLVERTPPRQRKKARGEGWIEDPETTVLFEKVQGRLEQRSGKKGDADERIKDLLGLSFDEFSKIVLLPQGEFAEFLKQNTNDRREVLKKLFPVDHAVRARELAVERSKTAGARLVEAERTLADAATRFDADAYENNRISALNRVTAAGEEAKRLEQERDRLTDELRAAEAEKITRENLRLAKDAEMNLDESAADIADQEKRLVSCRLARPLAPLLARVLETETAAEKAHGIAAGTTNKREKLSLSASSIENRSSELAGTEKESIKLREKRGPLAEAARDEKDLEAARAESRIIRQREMETWNQKEAADKAVRELALEISRLREKAETSDACDAAWETAREAMEMARTLKPLAERADRLRADRADIEKTVTALSVEISERETDAPILKAEIEEIEKLLREAELSGSASALASTLQAGSPCPVCGSPDHPRPAVAILPVFDLLARRDVRRRNAEDAAKALASKTTEAEALKTRLKRLDLEAAEIAALVAETGASLPTAAEAAARLVALSEATNTALVPRTEARMARDRLALLYREAEKSAEAAKRIDEKRSTDAARRAAIDAAIAEKEKRREIAFLTFDGETSALAALASIDERIAALDEAVSTWKIERENVVKALSAAAAEEKAMLTAAAEAQASAEKARAEFTSLLSRSPFPDEEALRTAILDRGEEERLEREIISWKDERSRLKTRREELEKNVERIITERRRADGMTPSDADEIATALERNRTAREAATAERDAANAAAHSFERDRAAFEEASERRRALADESALIKALAEDLAGNNPKKRSFDAWLLGAYLSEVAAFATKRLERMSEGRYRLLLDGDREGGRGQTGLDLSVFDSYTGRARPCATLSGGESFMASISLALGLADSIQARSGGVRLDAVFIDEGFGSLDDASLDKALGILDEIRDHRMVGLISHVGEMKSRIPSRLEIIKTNIGSRITVSAGI
ncbi:MAG: AAA family ATPase [Treponemataceae bacterium]